jgi:putative ABC transport system permease protein
MPQSELLRDELSRLASVELVTASANRPGGSDYGVPYRAVGVPEEEQPDMRCLTVDPNFLAAYDLELVAGRNFDSQRATDTAAYLINEKAAEQLGWTDDPLTHELSMPAVGRGPGPVIGVVRNFHYRSIHEAIAPLYIFYEPGWFSQLSVKLPLGNVEAGLRELEQAWTRVIPDYPFDYFFFDERYGQLYRADRRTATIVRWFSYVAVLITCLGLFGLSVYSMNRRRREVGIRRILGARSGGLLLLLSRDLLRPVGVALLLALPLGWYLTRRWLDNFAYHVDLDWWVFGLVALGTLLIALLTVSGQGLRTATSDPVESLRSE